MTMQLILLCLVLVGAATTFAATPEKEDLSVQPRPDDVPVAHTKRDNNAHVSNVAYTQPDGSAHAGGLATAGGRVKRDNNAHVSNVAYTQPDGSAHAGGLATAGGRG